jgi:hypothetical protein
MRNAFVFIVSLLCCGALWSQHWIGVSADADLAWQRDKMPETTTKLGGGGGIGFVYQFQRNHFIFETGLEGKFTYNPVGVADSLLHFNMIDTKGTPFIYNGYLKDRTDVSKNLSVNLPLMLGVEYNYFYGLVGAKLNYALLSRTHQTAQLATTGDYDIYYEILENVPTHGFHDYIKEESKGSMNYKLDARVAAELGAVFYSYDRSLKYRIGVFAEYGILDVRKSSDNVSLLTPDLTEYMHVNMNHIYSSSNTPTSPVHNLLCGLRFSILFPVGKSNYRSSRSYPCRCLND